MRRGGTYKHNQEGSGEQGFWPSYADMMSAVALILFFLMLLAYIQNLITGNNLQDTEEQLNATRQLVLAAQAELDDLSIDLNKKQEEIEIYALQISEKINEVSAQEKKLSEQQKLLSDQSKQLNAQKQKLQDQNEYLVAANKELVAMRDQMQSIAVLRLSIVEQIRDGIVDVMGDASKVSVGENGNIILSEGVLFDLGSSEIKSNSVAMLNELIDVFYAFLSNSDNSQYVDSIVISGHTDDIGTDESNRILSTDRANAVLNYLMAGKNEKLSTYAPFFCAAGYGETRPVADNSTKEGQAANRRIEISIILKDDTILDIVDDYLSVELPEGAEEAAKS